MNLGELDTSLITEATTWAAKKKRPLDPSLLTTVLEMRLHYGERSPGSWPAGSVQDLVLTRWAAHGPLDMPDPDILSETLETFWRFLRGTGRMTMASAEPAALVKELKRALPLMAEVNADRSNWSQGRILGDFGASLGIDLSEPTSLEGTQRKFDELVNRWNDLPFEERERLMPDPSPKSAAGAALTDALARMMADERLSLGLDPEPESGFTIVNELGLPKPERVHTDEDLANRQASESPLVKAALALADWVGERREVTGTGVLRPKLAGEAYLELGLIDWDFAFDRDLKPRGEYSPEDVARIARERAANVRSAVDLPGLDLLWEAGVDVGLIRTYSSHASAVPIHLHPDDIDWSGLGCSLLQYVVAELETLHIHALLGLLFLAMEKPDGEVPLAVVREWWTRDLPDMLKVVEALGRGGTEEFTSTYEATIDEVLRTFDNTGIWTRRDGWLAVTEFGREFALFLSALADDGMLFDEHDDDCDCFDDLDDD